MKVTKLSILAAAVLISSVLCGAACADATGNVFPSYPALDEGQRPLVDVGKSGILWWSRYSLGSGEHFESDPSTPDQAESKDGKFLYAPKRQLFGGAISLDDSRFLETNAYYRLTSAREFAISIGAQEVDEHRVTFDVWQPKEEGRGHTEDNAFFSSGDMSIHFDASNPRHKVHTATDASVIVHEYGHYVERALNPRYSNTGTDAEKLEARGLGEGFADFFANAMLNTSEQAVVFHSVHNHPGGIRTATNTKTYQDIIGAEVHAAGAVFSGMAWDMRQRFGPEVTNKLIIAGIRAARAPVTYRSSVQGLFVADNQLFQGKHAAEMKIIFANRGLDPNVAPTTGSKGTTLGSVVMKIVRIVVPGL